ncbi:MAG: leucine-rich repeat domain-containing protein [Candidatus Saccharibacteria bacterium]|nr:leucine-rich repeat domain-containing protein [Candidatus Saccharibacteria bacterium]
METPAQQPQVTDPMNQPYTPISESEMTGSDPVINNQQDNPGSKSGKNTLLTLGSLLVLAGIIGITLYLYIQNKTNTPTKSKIVAKIEPATTKDTTKPTPYVPTTPEEKKMAANLEKYGVICRRFTSVEEALKTPEIACVLDLSNQGLTSIPSEITTNRLQNISELNLKNNKISSIPQEIFSLKSIIKVDLSNNRIATLPSSIAKTDRVLLLILKGNEISKTNIQQLKEANTKLQIEL